MIVGSGGRLGTALVSIGSGSAELGGGVDVDGAVDPDVELDEELVPAVVPDVVASALVVGPLCGVAVGRGPVVPRTG